MSQYADKQSFKILDKSKSLNKLPFYHAPNTPYKSTLPDEFKHHITWCFLELRMFLVRAFHVMPSSHAEFIIIFASSKFIKGQCRSN